MPSRQESSSLGNASLILGIAAISLVFGIGICSLTGVQQGWIGLAATPLLICGASSAFLGFLGMCLGVAGMFGNHHRKRTTIIGTILSMMGICMFLFFLSVIGAGA